MPSEAPGAAQFGVLSAPAVGSATQPSMITHEPSTTSVSSPGMTVRSMVNAPEGRRLKNRSVVRTADSLQPEAYGKIGCACVALPSRVARSSAVANPTSLKTLPAFNAYLLCTLSWA